MHWATVVFLMAAAVSVMSWLAVEIYRFARGRSVISGGHLALRAVNAALVLGVVIMIMYGAYYPWPGGRDGAARELLYWSTCLAVVVLVILLTWRDWKMLLKLRHLQSADLYRRMDEELHRPTEAGGSEGD